MASEGDQLGFLEKAIKLIEKYGIFRIFKALCLIAILLYVVCNGADLIGNIVEQVTRETITEESDNKIKMHDIALEKRQQIKPQVEQILLETLNATNADRVFIIEMHNGTNNVSGLPFLYGEMTYERVAKGIEHVDEDYVKFSLSRFNFPNYIEKHHYWMGTIEEFDSIDDKLATRLKSNDVTYISIGDIHGLKNELGYFGITYCNGKEPQSRQKILTTMMEKIQNLSTLLDSSILIDDGTSDNEEIGQDET